MVTSSLEVGTGHEKLAGEGVGLFFDGLAAGSQGDSRVHAFFGFSVFATQVENDMGKLVRQGKEAARGRVFVVYEDDAEGAPK